MVRAAFERPALSFRKPTALGAIVPRWPFLLYRSVVSLPRSLDPAGIWEALFESNRWGDVWRGDVYDYLHYHSRIHEVLGIARGSATVRIGETKAKR